MPLYIVLWYSVMYKEAWAIPFCMFKHTFVLHHGILWTGPQIMNKKSTPLCIPTDSNRSSRSPFSQMFLISAYQLSFQWGDSSPQTWHKSQPCEPVSHIANYEAHLQFREWAASGGEVQPWSLHPTTENNNTCTSPRSLLCEYKACASIKSESTAMVEFKHTHTHTHTHTFLTTIRKLNSNML